jgi:uncharacterized metal-binding protein
MINKANLAGKIDKEDIYRKEQSSLMRISEKTRWVGALRRKGSSSRSIVVIKNCPNCSTLANYPMIAKI